jgi:hypothetical protein
MNEPKKRRGPILWLAERSWRFWTVVAIALVLLYPLSSGPAATIILNYGPINEEPLLSDWSAHVITNLYKPLRLIAGRPSQTNQLRRAWWWYLTLWVDEDHLAEVGGAVEISWSFAESQPVPAPVAPVTPPAP